MSEPFIHDRVDNSSMLCLSIHISTTFLMAGINSNQVPWHLVRVVEKLLPRVRYVAGSQRDDTQWRIPYRKFACFQVFVWVSMFRWIEWSRTVHGCQLYGVLRELCILDHTVHTRNISLIELFLPPSRQNLGHFYLVNCLLCNSRGISSGKENQVVTQHSLVDTRK